MFLTFHFHFPNLTDMLFYIGFRSGPAIWARDHTTVNRGIVVGFWYVFYNFNGARNDIRLSCCTGMATLLIREI